MALGDAMATALLALRGFTAQDFAKFHPGGSLGKQLYLKVQDIYIYNDKPCVELDASLEEIIVEISSKRLGATAVVNTQQQLKGIITDGDLRRMLSKHSNTSQVIAQEIMTPYPKTTSPTTLAVKAFQHMRENSITQLIVEEDGVYKGIVHLHDLIREGIV
jgi:arabinose-5-phosphate isomerase